MSICHPDSIPNVIPDKHDFMLPELLSHSFKSCVSWCLCRCLAVYTGSGAELDAEGQIEGGCGLHQPEQGHLDLPAPGCPGCGELEAQQCPCPGHGLHKRPAPHPAHDTQAGYVLITHTCCCHGTRVSLQEDGLAQDGRRGGGWILLSVWVKTGCRDRFW